MTNLNVQEQEDDIEQIDAAQTEETTDDQENTEETEQEEAADEIASEEGTEGEKQEFDPKKFVKIDDPAVQAKVDDLYKQVKMSDKRNQMLTGFLQEQQKQLDELKTRFSQTDTAQAEEILNSRLLEAQNNGDFEAANKITKELIDFKVGLAVKGIKPQERPKQQEIDPADERFVAHLAADRPWLRDDHPDNDAAVELTQQIAQEHEAKYGHADIGAVMKELDYRMAKKAPPKQPAKQVVNQRRPDPMAGGNLTSRNNQSKLKLSDQERQIARKLGISEDDYRKNK